MHKKSYLYWAVTVAAIAVSLVAAHPQTVHASGVVVSGTVVSPTGAALTQAGGFVSLSPKNPGPGNGGPMNNNGTFSITNVASGQYTVQVSYAGTDGNYTGPAPFLITIDTSAVDLGNIKLTTPSITGTVTNPDGVTPVPGTNVMIRTNDWSFNSGTNTDDGGNFKFGGLASGTYIIEAQAPESSPYTTGTLTVSFAGTVLTGQTVSLSAPNVTGTIKDPSGNAVDFSHGGNVNCNIYNQDHSVQMNTNADPSGVFRFGTMATGSYTLQCMVQGLSFTSPVSRTISVTSGTLLNVGEVRLTTAQVTGTVYAPDGATPVANANVQIHTDDWSVNQNAQSGQDGTYLIGGFPAGTYKLDVMSPWGSSGYVSPDSASITIGATVVVKNLTFVQASKFLTGKVTKSNGLAVAGAQINANKNGSGFSQATTDASGNYTLTLSGGSWNIMVNPNMGPGAPAPDWFFSGPPQMVDFATNSAVENKTLNITVTVANASVTGRALKPDGSPMTNANVDVRTQDGVGNNSQVRPDGTFSVNVKAGTYRVSVFSPDNTLSFPEMSVTIGDNETKNVGTITAKSKSAKITGKVVKSDGTGVGGVYLNAFMHNQPGWSNTQSDSNGNFVLAVTAGMWGVNLDQGPGRNSKYVYSGQPIDANVTDDNATINVGTIQLTYADATISGFVVNESGTVITGFCAWINAQPASATTIGNPGPGYGGPVDCQNGSFSLSVPSTVASTYTLSLGTPPNSPYSSLDSQNVAVFANTTSTKNIQVRSNDATVQGRILDQNGASITSCSSSGGWFGDVHFEKNGSWRGGDIKPDCTFSVSLLSGSGYHMGYYINPGNGFMMKPPDPTSLTIAAGTTTLNITVTKANATITGRVLDPSGNGIDAFVFADNGVEQENQSVQTEESFKNQLHADTKTNPDGTFTLNVLKGHRYQVGMGLPPGSSYIPADFQKVDLTSASTASITLKLGRALGTMSGSVKVGNVPINIGFVHCWEENGGFTGGPVQFGGSYSVNYKAGTWHCGADSFDGNKFYRSDEATITISTQTSITQNFSLKGASFTVPSPVSSTFDAGSAQVIALENGVTITIPSGALGSSGSNVSVTATPTVGNMYKMKNVQPFGVGYELTATDSSNNAITTFNSNVTIKFTYTQDQLDELGINEDTLVSKYFDSTSNAYQDPIGITVDKDSNTITIQTNHFTTFVVASGGSAAAGLGTADIATVPASKGGPQVYVTDKTGKKVVSFFAYASSLRVGLEVATGDVNGDGANEIVTAPGVGAGPEIRVFTKAGKLLKNFNAYGSSLRTGIHVAVADIDGNGKDEIIAVPLAGAGPQVRIFDGNGKLLKQFFIIGSGFRGGVNLAVSDVDGDGKADIIGTPASNGGPEVAIFHGDGKLVKRFNAYAVGVRGGYNLTTGDINGDGTDDVVVAPKTGLGPQVAAFNKDGKQLARFMAFPSGFRGGVNVAVADMGGDGTNEFIAMPMGGAISQVRVFNNKGVAKSQFNAYGSSLKGSFTMFAADVDGDGKAEIVTGPGAGLGPQISVFNQNGRVISRFFALNTKFRGGVSIFAAYGM